jgi:GMP synthase (glutamine-hydrolysing)
MILVIDCGSSKVPFIEECLDEFIDVETVTLNELHTVELSKYKGVVISGAPILLTEIDVEPYLEKLTWVQRYDNPILGICFGHQLLGMTYGAFVTRQKEDRDWQWIEVLAEDDLFNRFPTEFEMMEDHCETVSIPIDFIHLAVSDSCINEAMKHKEKSIYGVQFHPEVSGNLGRLLFDNFVRICERKNTNTL